MIDQTKAPEDNLEVRPDTDFVAWNEAMVERYDIDRYYERSHPLVRWVEARRLKALEAFASAQTGDRVLEVGCGAGHVLARFATANRTGIDLSSGMLERARRRLGPEVRLLRSQAERLPFADGSFDVVLCTEVLEHTNDPSQVISELLRVAGPDGRVIVSIPSEKNIDRAKRALSMIPILRRFLRSLADTGNEWHLHEFDLALLRQVSGRAHADIVRLKGVPSAVAPIRYVALLKSARENGRAS
jgi:ubiquinone/menaquinone biosynthesis C-methylase UbiE